MELLFAVIFYVVIVAVFAFFGRFLDEYDETVFVVLKTNSLNKKIAN